MRRQMLALAVALLAAVAVGCSDGEISGGSGTASADVAGDAFAVVGAEDAFANIEDATLSREMAMPAAVGPGGEFHRHRGHPGQPGSHLGPILRELGLDEPQRETIRAMLAAHREAVQPILEQLREVNRERIEQANAERERILERLRDGELTGEQAREMLRQLNEATRAAIRNNPANAPLLAELCEAKLALFDDLRALLTAEQQSVWDQWVAALPGECLGD